MQHLAISFAIVLGACATAPSTQHSRVRGPNLVAWAGDSATAWFPAPREQPRLPHVDMFGSRLVAIGADELTARVHVCVTPDGRSDVTLLTSSGVSYFDDALVRDVADWRYEPYAAPATAHVCKAFTLRYVTDAQSL